MINLFQQWYQRNFSDPQAVILLLLLSIGFLVVLYMGEMLAPVLASVVIAYMLEAVVIMLMNHKIPRLAAVIIVCVVFFFSLLIFILLTLPVLSNQVTQLVQELPKQIDKGQQNLLMLPERYPELVTEGQVNDIMTEIRSQITVLGQGALSISLASIPILFAFMIYLVLVPLLVFLFLKDKQILLRWFGGYMPQQRNLAFQVWKEMDQQIGNYVRGKFTEILIVGAVTYLGFVILGLNYAALLAVLVGLSVIIPYIGAVAVTVPVALIAYFQWGWTAEFAYLMIVYGVIQGVDGNVVVPLLFSEAVNLHPTAIIIAVLVFGGLWGLWGVFFAIPLATLVKAVLNAWPSRSKLEATEQQPVEE
jgi:putative permease